LAQRYRTATSLCVAASMAREPNRPVT